MTISNFETFEKELFEKLRKNSKKSLKIIDKNEKLIDNYFNGSNPTYVKKFVNDFNDVVLDKKVKKYDIFESVLKHKLFTNVLAQFRESDVLIRACKDVKKYHEFYEAADFREICNKDVVEWLLTMGINFGVQDENGATALMYAAKTLKLQFAVKKMMNGKHIYLLDNKGNSVLFYAADNFFSLEKFLKYKDIFDGNHLNNDNENIYTYCCRYRKVINIDFLKLLDKFVSPNKPIDPNVTNREGMTAAMYLTVQVKYKILEYFVKNYNIDPNGINKFGNTLVSVLIKKYYNYVNETIQREEGFPTYSMGYKSYCLTFQDLVKLGCDFNRPIDEEGNNVATILLKLHDEHILQYLMTEGGVEVIVDEKNKQSKTFTEIDSANPIIKTNLKKVNMWTKEVMNPKGTINTQLTGLIMMGLFK